MFGWVADDVDLGGMTATMWRVPGYGDVLAELDPGLRERHASPGVPPGFSDAVGWMLPSELDRPADWAVTFAADGTDAVVEKATRSGGDVVTEPYDARPARVAVLRDPQGAVFTVSTYRP